MRRALLSCLLLPLLACGGSGSIKGETKPDLPEDPDGDLRGDPDAGELAITAPEDNILVSARSIQVEGVVREGAYTEVDLAGETVAVAADGTFSARVSLEEGVNEIHARAGSADAWIVVRRDSIAPAITIRTPGRGAFIESRSNPSIEITGSITDAHGLQSVTVNGAPADVDASGAFRFLDSNQKAGVHYFGVQAIDNAGNVGGTGLSVLYGQFAPQEEPVTDAVVALAGPSVLTSVGHAAEDMLGGLDLEAAGLAANPVMDEWWATVDVTSVDRGALEIDPAPTAAGLAVTVTLHDLDVGFHVDLPGPYNPDGTAWADAAVLVGTVDVWATQSGTIDAALIEDTVSLEGFGFDLLPTGIEDVSFIRNAVQGSLESMVQQKVEELVPQAIAQQLSALDLSREIDLPALGTSLWIDVRPSLVEIDRGGVTLRADGALYGEDAGVTPASPGTLRTPSDAPLLSGDRMSVAFADDALNQVLSAAWRAGFLDRELPLVGSTGPVRVGALTLVFPALEGVAPGDTPVVATLDPLLPPVASLTAEGAQIEIGELNVLLEADTPEGRMPLVTLALYLTADLQADFGEGASVSLSLAGYDLVADPVQAPDGFPQGEEFHQIMSALIDMVAPEIGGPLASLPLPGFAGFTFAGLDASTDGPAGDYLTLSCDVRY